MHLFLIAGQSNAQGYGFTEGYPVLQDPRVFRIIKDKIEPAKEPLHHWPEHPWFPPEKKRGNGSAMPFALELLKTCPDWKIAFVPAAVGGSGIDSWLPGNENYKRALELVGNAKIEAVIWHQGEADSCDPEKARTYKIKFLAVMNGFRKDLGNPNLPVLAAELHRKTAPACKYHGLVSAQTKEAVDELGNSAFVSSEGLLPNELDPIHLDTPAVRELGKRFAEAYRKILSGSPVTEISAGSLPADS